MPLGLSPLSASPLSAIVDSALGVAGTAPTRAAASSAARVVTPGVAVALKQAATSVTARGATATSGPVVAMTGARASTSAGAVAATVTQVPFLDGHAIVSDGASVYYYSGHTGAATPVSLTTAHAGDVICVLAMTVQEGAGASPSVSSVTASGLTFTKRKALNGSSSSGGATSLELWYAVATTEFSGQITVTWSSVPTAMNVIAFGVANANTSAPFDPNASLPATAPAVDPPSVSGVSTTNPASFVVSAWAGSAIPMTSAGTPPSGFTAINSVIGAIWAGGFVDSSLAAAYQVTSAPLSNATIAWPYGAGSSGGSEQVIVDAIAGASSSSSGATASPAGAAAATTARSVGTSVSVALPGAPGKALAKPLSTGNVALMRASASAAVRAVTASVSAALTQASVSTTARSAAAAGGKIILPGVAGTTSARALTAGVSVALAGSRASASAAALTAGRAVRLTGGTARAVAAPPTALTTAGIAGAQAQTRGAAVAGTGTSVSAARGIISARAGSLPPASTVALMGRAVTAASAALSAEISVAPARVSSSATAQAPAGIGPTLAGVRIAASARFIGSNIPIALTGARMTAIARGVWAAWPPGLFVEVVSRTPGLDAVSRAPDYFAQSSEGGPTATMAARGSYALITQDNG